MDPSAPKVSLLHTSMRTLLIVKTGTSIRQTRDQFGDFDQWFRQSLGSNRFSYRTISVFADEPLPDPSGLRALAGIVITGSPAMVSQRHNWSERAASWLAEAHQARIPMLGVCFGHQLLAHALGGRVGPNPHGRRMGTFEVALDAADDPLFGPLGNSAAFQATHVEAVLEPPAGARVLGSTNGDSHHVLHFGHASWGVQFHPEFDADIMRGYVRARADIVRAEGQDPDRIIASIRPCPAGKRLMQQFAELVDGNTEALAEREVAVQ